MFMLVMNLLIPITMIGFGKHFIKKAPKEINGIYGYRTSMSMKNADTWVFAHHYIGKLWLILGCVILGPTVLAMIFVAGKDVGVVGTHGGIICGLQLIFLIVPIFPTEVALRNNFDENGNRKI